MNELVQPSTSPQLRSLTPLINNQLVSRALKDINHGINERESSQDAFPELSLCHSTPRYMQIK